MKKFTVDVDITVSKITHVEAENEEDAKKKANEYIKKEALYFASHADAYVCHEITDVIEED